MRTSPESGASKPAISRSVVDLPVPLPPMMPTASPRRMVMVASRRICLEPNDLETLMSSMRGGSSSEEEEGEDERRAREGCVFFFFEIEREREEVKKRGERGVEVSTRTVAVFERVLGRLFALFFPLFVAVPTSDDTSNTSGGCDLRPKLVSSSGMGGRETRAKIGHRIFFFRFHQRLTASLMLTALALVALFSPALIGEGIDPLLPFDGTGELDAPLVGEARARETKEQRRRHRCCRHLVAAELPPLGAKAVAPRPLVDAAHGAPRADVAAEGSIGASKESSSHALLSLLLPLRFSRGKKTLEK